MCCRHNGKHSASSRLGKHVSHSTDGGAQCQNISLSVVASVDASTVPLVMLQSRHVYLAVGDMSGHLCDVGVDVGKVNSPHIDISFEQLMIHLAQLQRMLVSDVAILNSCVS